MLLIKARGITFKDYYFNPKNLKVFSHKRVTLREVKPIKKYKEKSYKLFINGVSHVIKQSEIIDGLSKES